jgi:hypothetical protein
MCDDFIGDAARIARRTRDRDGAEARTDEGSRDRCLSVASTCSCDRSEKPASQPCWRSAAATSITAEGVRAGGGQSVALCADQRGERLEALLEQVDSMMKWMLGFLLALCVANLWLLIQMALGGPAG